MWILLLEKTPMIPDLKLHHDIIPHNPYKNDSMDNLLDFQWLITYIIQVRVQMDDLHRYNIPIDSYLHDIHHTLQDLN